MVVAVLLHTFVRTISHYIHSNDERRNVRTFIDWTDTAEAILALCVPNGQLSVFSSLALPPSMRLNTNTMVGSPIRSRKKDKKCPLWKVEMFAHGKYLSFFFSFHLPIPSLSLVHYNKGAAAEESYIEVAMKNVSGEQ